MINEEELQTVSYLEKDIEGRGKCKNKNKPEISVQLLDYVLLNITRDFEDA